MATSAMIKDVRKIRAVLDAQNYKPAEPATNAMWQSVIDDMRALEVLPGEGMAQTWAAMKTSGMVHVVFEALFLSIGNDPQVG